MPGDQNLLLANFHTKQRESRQIDLVVITPTKALLLEVKHLTGAVYGDVNGPWRVKNYAGNLVEYDGGNDLRYLLQSIPKSTLIEAAYLGRFGESGTSIIRQDCERLLRDAAEDVPNVRVELVKMERPTANS